MKKQKHFIDFFYFNGVLSDRHPPPHLVKHIYTAINFMDYIYSDVIKLKRTVVVVALNTNSNAIRGRGCGCG